MNQLDRSGPIRKELGEMDDLDAIETLMAVKGLTVADIGCGAGQLSRALCARGATVLGVEPDPVQTEKNRGAEQIAGLTFVESGAEILPIETGSMDGVFFMRSLHHVPKEHRDTALIEAARVLKPKTGFLYVVEPAIDGSFFAMMKPFHDETKVRKEAQEALARTASGLFKEIATYRYVQRRAYDNFETLVSRVSGTTFNDIAREKVETDEVRALFEKGRQTAGDYVFYQPMLLDLYKFPQ